MNRKYLDVADLTALGAGEMVALASAFGNIDAQGDRVMPGAFARSVAKIKAGATVPLIWGHDAHGSPQNFVGEVDDADETDEGLEVRAKFDLEDPVARKAYKLVKRGAIDKLSIGYRLRDQRRAKDGANELIDIELKEVSLVLTPANQQTRVLAVKDTATAVPTDAELHRRAEALGIPPPMSKRELRQHGDEVRLEVVSGMSKGELRQLSKAAEREDKERDGELRELRRRSRDVELEAALGFEFDLVDRVKAKHRGSRRADLDQVRANSREYMLALLTGAWESG